MKDQFLAEHKIKPVPLQLSHEAYQPMELSENVGHYHRRDDLVKIYNQSLVGNIDYPHLFIEAKRKAQQISEQYCSTEEAKEHFIKVHGNIVGVIGQAGCGKTTFSKMIVQSMLEERLWNLDLIFFIKFRDIDYNKRTNLLDFLTNDCLPYTATETKSLLEVVGYGKVGIILDGFDEAEITETFSPKCSIYDVTKAEVFIKNLLAGNILPEAKLLFTSRPKQIFELHEDYKPTFIVNILGLDDEAQKQICFDICEGEEAKKDKLFDYLNTRPELKGYCFVPYLCILVMSSILLSFRSGNMVDMDSITTIIVAVLHLFVKSSHHRSRRFQLPELCHLAFKGFKSNKLYFTQADLLEEGISMETATAFLTSKRMTKQFKLKLLDGLETHQTYFSHLMLQEFFVALYLFIFAGEKQFAESANKLADSKYEMVSKFLFGLCNSTTLEYLQNVIPSETNISNQIKAKKSHLKELVRQELVKKSQKIHDDKYHSWFSRISAWVYEMRDDHFTAEIANYLGDRIDVKGIILPSDVPAFHYLLRAKTTPMYISVQDGSSVSDHAANELSSVLDDDAEVSLIKVSYHLSI